MNTEIFVKERLKADLRSALAKPNLTYIRRVYLVEKLKMLEGPYELEYGSNDYSFSTTPSPRT